MPEDALREGHPVSEDRGPVVDAVGVEVLEHADEIRPFPLEVLLLQVDSRGFRHEESSAVVVGRRHRVPHEGRGRRHLGNEPLGQIHGGRTEVGIEP